MQMRCVVLGLVAAEQVLEEAEADVAKVGARTRKCSLFAQYRGALDALDTSARALKVGVAKARSAIANARKLSEPSFIGYGLYYSKISTRSSRESGEGSWCDERMASFLLLGSFAGSLLTALLVCGRYGMNWASNLTLVPVALLSAWLLLRLYLEWCLHQSRLEPYEIDTALAQPDYGEIDRGVQIADADLAARINSMSLDLGRDFRGALYRFQETGAKFLIAAEQALLGDEMGLGKTVQALAAFVHLARQEGSARALVICPAHLVLNWERETLVFTRLRPAVIKGPERERAYEALASEEADMGIVSYETFLRDYPSSANLPSSWDWRRVGIVAVDEAQRIRNRAAQTAIKVKKLLRHADYRFLLTGTPLENRAEDLHSLTEALGNPLGDFDQFQQDLAAASGPQFLRQKAARFYLRRKKDDVFEDLPEVVEQSVYLELSTPQRRAYLRALESQGSGYGLIMKLRQLVNMCPRTGQSPKMDYMQGFLQESREDGDKVVVFSFFLSVLERLQRETGSRFRIDGNVPSERRTQLIDEFSAERGHAVMLIQIIAGGVGLNLQAANRVVIFEPQWNPAVEDQAIARLHRIGQARSVHAVRLLTRDTIEERVEQVLTEKRELFNELVDEAELGKQLAIDWKRLLDEERRRLGVRPAA